MKKFLSVLAIAGFLVACNNDASSTDASKDSADMIDSMANRATDSIENKSDSLQNAIDSAANAAKDSLRK